MLEKDRLLILAVLDVYCKAFAEADADTLRALLCLDDKRFTAVEDHIPMPFGRDAQLDILDRIRTTAAPGGHMAFTATQFFSLGPTAAYGVAVQKVTSAAGSGTSRVTLIFVKEDGIWKILHGHFSAMPT